jgi:hypothetical protein
MYIVFKTVLGKSYVGAVHILSRTRLCTGRGLKQVILHHIHTQITTYVVMSVHNEAICYCGRLPLDVTQFMMAVG